MNESFKIENKSRVQLLIREIRELGLITLYFLCCFLFFLSLKKLLLEEYRIEVHILGAAIIGALIVAKVVLIFERTSFGNFFKDKILILHVLWRSLVYTAIVFVVTLGEHLFERYRKVGDVSQAISSLWLEHNIYHFFAMNIAVAVSFLIYNVGRELDCYLGKGELLKLFLSIRRSRSTL